MTTPLDELPKVGAPATRALTAAGFTTLHELIDAEQKQLEQLHGVGPRALRIIDEAYVGLGNKAAALLHSLTHNRGLVHGSQRLALAATIAFLGVNGHRLTLSNDQAYELVMSIAVGDLDEIAGIAERIATARW